jgi:competence ComEA-like helix-hairpin-helix protein
MNPSVRCACALLIAAAAPVYYGAQEPQAEPPPEFKRVCVRCHASDKVMEGRRFASQWEQVLEQMVARGATGTDEEFDVVFDYLVSERGRVAINTAAAAEIAQVLHLEAAMGDAIVQHRAKNGNFADFDALAAVPGLDVTELRKRRDAIVF